MRARVIVRRFFRIRAGKRDAHIHLVERSGEAYARLEKELAGRVKDARVSYTEQIPLYRKNAEPRRYVGLNVALESRLPARRPFRQTPNRPSVLSTIPTYPPPKKYT